MQYNQQLKPIASAVQYYGFYDVGAVHNALSSIDVPQSQSLAYAGGGMRFDLPLGFSGLFEVAKPLTKPVATEVLMHSHDPKKPHIYFAVTKRFKKNAAGTPVHAQSRRTIQPPSAARN